MPMSQLDQPQVIKTVYDATNEALRVNIVAGASITVDFSQTDDTPFGVGVDNIAMVGAFADEVGTDSVDEGDAGALRMSTNRNLYTQIRDAAGNERGVNVSAANALKVDGSAVTQPISATSLPLPTGASTAALQTQPGIDIGDVTVNNATGAAAVNVQDGGNSLTVDGTVAATQSGTWTVQPGNTANTTAWLVTGTGGTFPATQSGTWNINNISGTISLPTGAATESTLSTLNGKIPANLTVSSTRLLVDASGTTQPVSSTLDLSSTSTLSNVSGSATSVSLLASTAGRKGAYFFNDSTAILYLKFGTTASTSSYTVQIQPGGFFEMPPKPVYTGAIDGIWSVANGAARITELS